MLFVNVELLFEEEAACEGVLVLFVFTFAELFIEEEEFKFVFCEFVLEVFISAKSMGLFGVLFELFDSRLWVLKM